MRPLRRSCSLALVLALACCSRSPADKLKTELQTVASWAATARMAGEEWLKGSVPRAYAAQTLQAAEETLEEEARALREQKREGAAVIADGASATIGQMRAAVEGGDRQALAQSLKYLRAEEQLARLMAEGIQP